MLVADGINERDVSCLRRAVREAGISDDRVIFFNFHKAETEPYELAGSAAMNAGLDIIEELPQITHVARLDDDDIWFPEHLKTLVDVYQRNSKVGFVYGSAVGFHDSNKIIPELKENIRVPFRFLPHPCTFSHSAASWRLAHWNPRYRTLKEQALFRVSTTCCIALPCYADADLWAMLMLEVQTGKFDSWLIPKPTTRITGQKTKKRLLEKINENRVKICGSKF